MPITNEAIKLPNNSGCCEPKNNTGLHRIRITFNTAKPWYVNNRQIIYTSVFLEYAIFSVYKSIVK